MRNRVFAALLGLALAAFTAPAAWAETRVALIIANASYQNAPRLNNPGNDGPGVAAALRRAGFATTTIERDLGFDGMRRALRAFAEQARGADLAVVYYAGHGMEIGGANYLIPVDARLATDADVQYEAVPLDLVTQAVSGARRLGLVMLDSCRNNPFDPAMRRAAGVTRAVNRGLIRVEPAGNTLVVYAARDGTTAEDGAGGNSPFAAALMRRLPSPGLEISLLFRQVRDDVMRATNNVQQPFVYGSLGGDPIYLIAPNSNITVNVNTGAAPVAPPPRPAGPFSPLVQQAVEQARSADKAAQDRATAARQAQATALRAATASRAAALRAERGEPGHGVLTGTGVAATGAAVTWRYAGEVANGLAQGPGVRNWSDGFRQEGEWVAGVYSGFGVTTDPRGNFVVGRWARDAMDLVVEALPNGERFEGEYAAGRRASGVFIGGPERPYAEMSGQWSGLGLSGFGVIRWRDGSRTEGAFAENLAQGPSGRTDPQGRVVEQGVYQAGRLVTALTP